LTLTIKRLVIVCLFSAIILKTHAAEPLLIYGGDQHETFLGCLNCSKFDTNSVSNTFGPHGSAFASDSIFNQFGYFGSTFSSLSVCSVFAGNPPIVVNQKGESYGRLTLNAMAPNAIKNGSVVRWLRVIVCHQAD